MDFAKFLGTPFLTEHFWWLLLVFWMFQRNIRRKKTSVFNKLLLWKTTTKIIRRHLSWSLFFYSFIWLRSLSYRDLRHERVNPTAYNHRTCCNFIKERFREGRFPVILLGKFFRKATPVNGSFRTTSTFRTHIKCLWNKNVTFFFTNILQGS